MKKILLIFLVLQLLLVNGVGFADEKELEAPSPEKKVNASISLGNGPRQSALTTELDYRDPASYPLVGSGELAALLLDTYSGYQYVFFDEITTPSEGSDDMDLTLLYGSDELENKNYYLNIEFYTDEGGTLYFAGQTLFNTYREDALYLISTLSKSSFATQPYIYIRIGILENSYDDHYTDAATFKVVNPFYSTVTPPADDKYVVISNESIDPDAAQSTGVFTLKNMEYSKSKSLKQSAYKLDVNKPFNLEENTGKQLRKSMRSLTPSYKLGDTKEFWVTNFEINSSSRKTAKLAYSGSNVNVWVDPYLFYGISDGDAVKLGQEFDGKIYPSVTANFGQESDVNNDRKIDILVYDIQDGFNGSGGFVGGYFYGGDLYNVPESNQSEILYIDTYPSMGSYNSKDVTLAYETVAHEFQHMVNFNRNVLIEGSSSDMDVWLNESLSMAAEQIYSGQGLSDRLSYYNISSSIQNGHSLLNWDGDLLSNYSLSYLFGQYLKIQANQGDRIFKEILEDPNNNYLAIENIAKKYISPDMTFGKLMTNFRIALLLKEPTGLYGFKGDPFFDALKEKIYLGNSANLRGGGAIVSTFNSKDGFAIPADKGGDITYTTLNRLVGSNLEAPSVNKVTDHETVVTGTSKPLSTVIAQVSGKEIGRAVTAGDRSFLITIPKQPAGTVIEVVAVDEESGTSSVPVQLTVTPKLLKLIGDTRYTTAVKVSQTGWKTSNTVLLVNGEAIVDGLTATPLASAKDAPILLTLQNTLLTETLNELKRLQANEIIIIGGTGVISEHVENKLWTEGFTVKRIGGIDRYATSLLIAKELDKLVDVNTAYVAYGRGEPDALSIAAQAGLKKQPIILSDISSVPADTLAWLKTEALNYAYFIGGTGVITENVVSQIDKVTVMNEPYLNTRISGSDRQETNANVIKKFFPQEKLTSLLLAKAETNSLVDALSAGPLAAKLGSPVVLVSSYVGLKPAQKEVLRDKETKFVHQIGGGVNATAVNELVK